MPSSQSSSPSGSQSTSQSRSQSNSQSNSKKNNRRSSGQNCSRGSNSGGGLSSDRQRKGSNDLIKMANKFGVLHDPMDPVLHDPLLSLQHYTIYRNNEFRNPRRVQKDVIHGLVMNVKRQLTNANRHYKNLIRIRLMKIIIITS